MRWHCDAKLRPLQLQHLQLPAVGHNQPANMPGAFIHEITEIGVALDDLRRCRLQQRDLAVFFFNSSLSSFSRRSSSAIVSVASIIGDKQKDPPRFRRGSLFEGIISRVGEDCQG